MPYFALKFNKQNVNACYKNYIIGNYVQIRIQLYNLWRHAFIFYLLNTTYVYVAFRPPLARLVTPVLQ